MNKGLKLRFCTECKRNRFCIREKIPGYDAKYTCSKGHIWHIEKFTTEKLNDLIKATFSSERMKSLFERDDIFFNTLKRR